MSERTARALSHAALAAIALVYLHNAVPYLTMLPRINVDEPWLIERAYQLATTGSPSQPMFLLDRGYLLQPGYSLVLAPWIELFGVGLFQARVLAVLFGLGTLLAVYALGRQLFGSAVGAVAALFLATDSNFLGVARMARTDAPAVFFVALGLALSLYGLRRTRVAPAVGGGLATGMAMLCHANSYWVGIVVLLWYLAAYGWRVVLTPSAYGYAAGLALSFGPYLAIVLTNIEEFNAQLHMFAIERVPGFSPAQLWFQITQEPLRYRDWYFGLITNDLANPILVVFQVCAAAGAGLLAWQVWSGRGTQSSVRAETLAALLVFGSAAIFASLIPNKALVYLPHLLVGLALAAGFFVTRALQLIPTRGVAAGAVAPAPAVFVVLMALGAVALYQHWYSLMRSTELQPYEETHALVDEMVPPGPKYLVASPTFWLPFVDDPDTRFIAYSAAGPYDSVEWRGYYTRQRLFDLPQDRPFFLLVDETEWRAVLADGSYDPYWRSTWIGYIRQACAPLQAAFGTAHGTITLYRCWSDRQRRPVTTQYSFRGRQYVPDGQAWSADPAAMATWERYRPDTRLVQEDGRLQISAPAGGGIWTDVPVQPGTAYLLKVDAQNAVAADQMSLHEMGPDGRPTRSQWLKLDSTDWFPDGTIVRPSTSPLRIYLYSESATSFSVGSIRLIALADAEAANGSR